MKYRTMLAVCVLLAGAGGLARAADEIADAAAKIEKDYAKAVVHLEGVLSVTAEGQLASMMGGERERKIEAVGTMVDPSGLTVTSLTSVNPIGDERKVNVRVSGQAMSATLKGEVSEMRIRLTDGTEVPARIVLKDEDLDLAFIAPKEKLDPDARKQTRAVDLTKAASQAARLTQAVMLGRLDKHMNRELVVRVRRVAAVITKPRTFYFFGAGQPGAPAFTTDGKLLGINVFRKKPGGGSVGRTVAVSGTGVTLPAKDVKRIADQAKEELAKKKAQD